MVNWWPDLVVPIVVIVLVSLCVYDFQERWRENRRLRKRAREIAETQRRRRQASRGETVDDITTEDPEEDPSEKMKHRTEEKEPQSGVRRSVVLASGMIPEVMSSSSDHEESEADDDIERGMSAAVRPLGDVCEVCGEQIASDDDVLFGKASKHGYDRLGTVHQSVEQHEESCCPGCGRLTRDRERKEELLGPDENKKELLCAVNGEGSQLIRRS